jgi:hypothetical protein
MSNKRKIFVGSSQEAELMANKVIGQLIKEAGMELVPWRDIFTAGAYPLEVFEEIIPNEVIGAVLIATPDVFGKRGAANFDEPVANVVLEYGYLAARLGRSRVAICEFDDVAIPSDLQGLTNVRAGKYEKDRQSFLGEGAQVQLNRWLQSLPHLAEEIPPIRQLHGYSGKWNVKSYFSRWRGRPVNNEKKEEVTFNGTTFLFVDVDGKRVSGMLTGILTARLDGGYREDRKIFNEIVDGSLDKNGILTISLKVHHRNLIRPVEGMPPDDLGEDRLKDLEQEPPFKIILQPVQGKAKYLRGSHCYDPGQHPHQLADEDWEYSGL